MKVQIFEGTDLYSFFRLLYFFGTRYFHFQKELDIDIDTISRFLTARKILA